MKKLFHVTKLSFKRKFVHRTVKEKFQKTRTAFTRNFFRSTVKGTFRLPGLSFHSNHFRNAMKVNFQPARTIICPQHRPQRCQRTLPTYQNQPPWWNHNLQVVCLSLQCLKMTARMGRFLSVQVSADLHIHRNTKAFLLIKECVWVCEHVCVFVCVQGYKSAQKNVFCLTIHVALQANMHVYVNEFVDTCARACVCACVQAGRHSLVLLKHAGACVKSFMSYLSTPNLASN